MSSERASADTLFGDLSPEAESIVRRLAEQVAVLDSEATPPEIEASLLPARGLPRE